jgi:hypothetical protein
LAASNFFDFLSRVNVNSFRHLAGLTYHTYLRRSYLRLSSQRVLSEVG